MIGIDDAWDAIAHFVVNVMAMLAGLGIWSLLHPGRRARRRGRRG